MPDAEETLQERFAALGELRLGYGRECVRRVGASEVFFAEAFVDGEGGGGCAAGYLAPWGVRMWEVEGEKIILLDDLQA